jgi:hypothetical protein
MRRVFLALAILAMVGAAAADDEKPATSAEKGEPAKTEPRPAETESRLTMKDLARMRQGRMTPAQIVDKASEQGVGFEVTPAVQNQLRRMGFKPDQIASLRAISNPLGKTDKPGALVPGQGLRTTDAQRDGELEDIRTINKHSGVALESLPCQHVTLWSAKDVQPVFAADIKRLERFLETKCKEPIRSGLDRRSAHLVVLKSRYEYEKWIAAMFEVVGEPCPDNPTANKEFKEAVAKGFGYVPQRFGVVCLEGQQLDWVRRVLATDLGYMYFTQLIESQQVAPLATGFANGVETVLAGQPGVVLFSSSYHESRNLDADNRNWLRLVQQRITAKQITRAAELVRMDTTSMLLHHYAESWTLASLLARQPAKFGDLMLALRDDKDVLKVIERIYGWDEKTLDEEWHKYVLSQR